MPDTTNQGTYRPGEDDAGDRRRQQTVTALADAFRRLYGNPSAAGKPADSGGAVPADDAGSPEILPEMTEEPPPVPEEVLPEEPLQELPEEVPDADAAPMQPAADPAAAVPAVRKKSEKAVRARRKREALPAETVLRPDPVTTGMDLRRDEMLVYDSELDELDYYDEEDLPEVRDYLPIRFARQGRLGISGGILYALAVICVSIVMACLLWMFTADVLALGKDPQEAVVYIDEYVPEGDDPVYTVVRDEEREILVDIDQVAAQLKQAGIIEYKWLFKLFSSISHAETKIEPGTYAVSTALDYRAIVTSLRFGSENQQITRVTFPEGYSMEQIFALLEENRICRVSDLTETAANYEFSYDFLEGLETGDANRLQGYLFPDTYEFYQFEDASVTLDRFLRNFNKRFTEEMRQQAADMGYTVHEILTIASLIEKESGNADESPVIASVIYNRLREGWKLGLDSTINYILGTSTFDLSYDDLAIDDPYNTYLYEGLPPGPICNPGLASIEAALHPESTDYWYWYAVDGETHFFKNADDFNAFAEAHPY